MSNKPIIGITCNISYSDKQPIAEGIGVANQNWQLLADDYIMAVKRAGGIPVMLPLVDDEEVIKELVDMVDGVLISGGTDVDPRIFNQLPTETIKVDPFRDKCDIFMTKYVIEKTKKPVLGICRGILVLNVAMGGTIYQDIGDMDLQSHTNLMYPKYEWSHKVKVSEDSHLKNAVKKDHLGVNSFHHEGVDRLGEQLKVVAVAEDGLVEGVELINDEDRFVLAVQWHPEMMSEKVSEQQAIVDAFVNAGEGAK